MTRIIEGSVLVPVDKLLLVTDNHGGYKSIRCIVCDAYGWDDRLEHRSSCPLQGVNGMAAATEISKRELSTHGRVKNPSMVDLGVTKTQ